jgi:hypothetical protein
MTVPIATSPGRAGFGSQLRDVGGAMTAKFFRTGSEKLTDGKLDVIARSAKSYALNAEIFFLRARPGFDKGLPKDPSQARAACQAHLYLDC